MFKFTSMDQNSMEKLASAASAVLEAVQSESGTYQEASGLYGNIQTAETPSYGSDIETGVRLHNRAVSIFFASVV